MKKQLILLTLFACLNMQAMQPEAAPAKKETGLLYVAPKSLFTQEQIERMQRKEQQGSQPDKDVQQSVNERRAQGQTLEGLQLPAKNNRGREAALLNIDETEVKLKESDAESRKKAIQNDQEFVKTTLEYLNAYQPAGAQQNSDATLSKIATSFATTYHLKYKDEIISQEQLVKIADGVARGYLTKQSEVKKRIDTVLNDRDFKQQASAWYDRYRNRNKLPMQRESIIGKIERRFCVSYEINYHDSLISKEELTQIATQQATLYMHNRENSGCCVIL